MLFNSIEFLIFLPVVFLIYWALNHNLKVQNIFIVAASYFFYGWWDWRFLLLIAFTTTCSWAFGIGIQNEQANGRERRAKAYSAINIAINLGILALFKYYNFFVESFVDAFSMFGKSLDAPTLKIVLPVGISFYTFQALSYTIDVYKKKLPATKDIVAYFAYVSFFPQLVAGPIERATNLLPQFFVKRHLEWMTAKDGLKQMLWGFFKKMVVADTCAQVVNEVFRHSELYSGSTLALGAVFFCFQIYCDFSGYSDIAIGTAKLFGFTLRQNFRYPFFARDIAEFWRRWHISLTTWFRDYVYIPLGGSRVAKWKIIRNTFIIYLLSGFWHGANWTFIVWGALNAIFFMPLILAGKNRKNLGEVAQGKCLPGWKEFGGMVLTFALVTLGFIVFRAQSISQAWEYLCGICSPSLFSIPRFRGMTNVNAIFSLIFIAFLLVVEWLHRDRQYGLELDDSRHLVLNVIMYIAVFAMVYCFGVDDSSFIYFQF